MNTITTSLAKTIATIDSQDDFYANGQEPGLPALEVEGIGRIALPLLPVQAEQLIALATQAPYGRGEQTLIDTTVRKTWQIAADAVHLSGQHWAQALERITGRVARALGVAGQISAELYKLLLYDEGGFFLEHRDTEKTPGMFATLVIVLPALCSGGELIVRHQGREVSLDLNAADPGEFSFAAFYADCVHEVRPVTSGYRLTLIYNLTRKGAAPLLAPADHAVQQTQLTYLLLKCAARLAHFNRRFQQG